MSQHYWTADQITRLLEELAAKHQHQGRTAALIMWRTGLRVSEALNLEWRDLKYSGDPPTLIVRQSKTWKARRVRMHPEPVQLFTNWPANRAPRDRMIGLPMRTTIRHITEAVETSGLQEESPGSGKRRPGPHSLRHSAARHWLVAGRDRQPKKIATKTVNSVETSDVKNEREKWLSPRTEAAWTTIAAAVYLLTTVLIVGLVAIYLGAYDDETVDDAMTGLEFFGTIPLAITFLMWVYRASNNLKAIGVEEQRFSPWGAVGWWFVPFANLVLPGKAVIEIWSKSSTKEQVSQAIPLAWWFTLIISRVLFSILDLIPVEHVTSEYVTLIGLGFISATLLDTVALGLMLAVVWTITTNQIKRHDKMQPTTPSDGLEIEDQTWAHDRSR